MKNALPDLDKFERSIFKRKKPLVRLLSFSLVLMQARQAGLLLGTNRSYRMFVPPEKWDRGVMDRFYGRGISGLLLKCFGKWIVRFKGLSPVMLYKQTHLGEKKETDGLISYVLRKQMEYYEKGIKILLIDNIPAIFAENRSHSKLKVLAYDGNRFEIMPDLMISNAIISQFHAKNCLLAYIPDYGAIVFNNIQRDLVSKNKGRLVNEPELRSRLDILISAIEMASLAHLGEARGRQAARILWRKENRLRRTAKKLKSKERELAAQKRYLQAVGAVNEEQLNMEAISITDGVYAFMDMVGSATIRKKFNPREYFYILNLCHQIAADNAALYGCRVDNFIGDSVFLQNVSPFDRNLKVMTMGSDERIMLLVLAISSTIIEIHQLKKGCHAMDPAGKVKKLITDADTDIGFRAGMEIGTSMIGPIGSQKRKIVTAIGKAVNNASRLESTGIQEWIHVSENIRRRLDQAFITKDTRVLCRTIESARGLQNFCKDRPVRFLDDYQKWINSKKPVIRERKNIAYKEYSREVSYLVQCLPDADFPFD